MNFFNNEKEFFKNNQDILKILLIDRTTNKNIIWASKHYTKYGFLEKEQIKANNIISGNLIKPRIEKNKVEQSKRSKDMAEVFTPSWLCNRQNNFIDDASLGYENAFNVEGDKTWTTTTEKVIFLKPELQWKTYVRNNVLEITCGEAPYLVSRYDSVSGEKIELNNRIGLLDRKFRIINENAESDEEWIEQSLIALEATYGYEYQGDNLFIARQNILFTFIENFWNKFNEFPDKKYLEQAAKIISWNLWQMDGLKYVIPFSCKKEEEKQLSLFETNESKKTISCVGCKKIYSKNHNGIFANIMDWEEKKVIRFVKLLKGDSGKK